MPYDNQVASLPFGMVLKWPDGTRLEEVQAMKVARAAGFPVPRVICYGEHPESPHALISILMVRVPGKELGQVYENLNKDERETILKELYLDMMRTWPNPWGGDRICSITGSTIRSVRVPFHKVGPCENENEFNNSLIRVASPRLFPSKEIYRDVRNRAEKIHSLSHRIVFTHGDLKHHNIMVYNGHISGLLDWESAEWYPDYRECTTSLRFTREEFWWFDFAVRLGGQKYLVELECERALTWLTSQTYFW